MSPDEARLEMVHELHKAVFGDSWARPESPKEVWEMLLREVRRMSRTTLYYEVVEELRDGE